MRRLLFILFLVSISAFGQQKAHTEEDALFLSERAQDTLIKSPETAIKYLRAAGYWFESNPTSEAKIYYYERLGSAFNYLGKRDSCKKYFDLATTTAINLNNYELAIAMQSRYAMTYLLPMGMFDEALDRALSISEHTKDVENASIKFRANRLLIDIYWDLDDFKEEFLELAIECQELAYELDDNYFIRTSLFDLASAYGRNGKHELAIQTYKRVAKIQLEVQDYFVSASYNNLALQYQAIEEYDSAIYYFSLGKHYSELQGRQEGVAASKLYMGQLYLVSRDYQLALDNCRFALKTLQNLNVIRRQEECTSCIVEAYEKLGKHSEAYDFLKLDIALKDSLLTKGEEKELKLMRNEFDHKIQTLTDSLDFAYTHELNNEKIEQQKKRTYLLYIILGLTGLFAFFILNRFRITRRQKKIIENQKIEVEKAHEELTEKNQEILDSISYAKRIQKAILPPDKLVQEKLPNSFILYIPKDIVAGDFYWLETQGDKVLFAAADCTGHGVPGAMVSVVCNNGLNRSVREEHLSDPGQILDKTREIIVNEFEKSEDDVKDGMDVALCSLEGTKLSYAGANNPLWIIRNGASEIEEYKANKQPIGKYDNPMPYTSHHIDLNEGDTFYVFSDGFADQFGGEKGKKFKAANFMKLLLSVSSMSMKEQKVAVEKAFIEWKGELEQLDDICIIGVRI